MPADPTKPVLNEDRERLDLLAQLLAAEEGLDAQVADTIPRRANAGSAPLSFAQEVLWMLDRATPGMTAYNSPIAVRIDGALDHAALQRAVDALAARHEALRTVIRQSGERAVQSALPAGSVAMAERDVRDLPEAERADAALRFLRGVADTPFDLTTEPPFRVALARTADREHLLLLLTHHIVSDAWSYGVIFRELTALYEGSPLAPVSLQIGDYAAWQRELMHGDELERRLAFWRERLASLPVLDLPTDRPRPSAQDFAGARCTRVLPRATLDALQRFARHHETTTYAVLLAAYQSVLHRYSGQDDIVVGSAVAGRTRSETEGMVGYLSQALPMRTRFDGDPTFAQLVARTADNVLGAFEHQDVPLEALVLDLQRQGRPSHAPLFRVVLTMQETLPATLRLGEATTTPLEIDAGGTKFDLTLLASERDDGLELTLWYRTDLFDAPTGARFLGHLQTLLEAALADPEQPVSRLPMLTAGERVQIDRWSSNPHPFHDLACVHATFASHAARAPHAAALTGGDERLTYGELDARANRLAHVLRGHGAGPGTPVGLALDRGAAAIVAVLAILKAGAAYVPLMPDTPPARLASQLREAGVAIVVTIAAAAGRFPGDGVTFVCIDRDAGAITAAPDGEPVGTATLDDPAYILFTSGSTGIPKGVAVSHRNIANYTAAISDRLDLNGQTPLRFATVSTLGADLGNTAIFPALCSGGELFVVPSHASTEPTAFAEFMSAHQIDVLKITPNHLAALLPARETAAALPARWLVLGGEACPIELAERVRRDGRARVLNHYGPTETTVGACTFEAGTDLGGASPLTVPLGTPLANVRCYVLDAAQQPVPVGVPAELFIGGDGVAAGYVNRPELTAERFLRDPFEPGPLARMYRTGDRVRRLRGGEIEFIGRLDDQVKIRGYRVELGDIEAALALHPDVVQAAATYRAPASGPDGRLLAYAAVRSLSDPDVSARALRDWLAERLPEHMVPETVTPLERLPLNANGKVDRTALPEPLARTDAADAYVAPRTPTETAIAALWCDVLKLERVGVHDGFLELGGHSILAIRLLGRLSRTFGVRISLRALFDGPTVAQLATAVDEAVARVGV